MGMGAERKKGEEKSGHSHQGKNRHAVVRKLGDFHREGEALRQAQDAAPAEPTGQIHDADTEGVYEVDRHAQSEIDQERRHAHLTRISNR